MRTIDIQGGAFRAVDYRDAIGADGGSLPYSLRIVAENALRQDPDGTSAMAIARRRGEAVPFRPRRLLLQDMLGLPLLVDLMAMRSAVADAGGDPARIDMTLPVDLVIDHSMTIEHWADKLALPKNQAREFEVNRERFAFIKACEARFPNLRVFPPGGGIMHQINLEFLGRCVAPDATDARLLVPDTNLGMDSHTPMINALGILGWGIGGLEAEAIMFGEAATINVPRVIGLEVTGTPDSGITATDIALTVAEKLRAVGVVDCFVELFGASYGALSVADRGTIANMAPEYGATSVFCPVDQNTVRYLKETGRAPEHVALVEAYCRAQGLWADEPDASIAYEEVVTLDLGGIGRSVAGPSRPEQRIDLGSAPVRIGQRDEAAGARRIPVDGRDHDIGDGDVIIAAITSCTNTANPRNIVLAGLLARNAVARGLSAAPHVKTSLAPGSRVVARYLDESGLQASLDALGFQIAAFSCSTCNGMSGPLAPEIEAAIRGNDLNCVAVLSGNRNFAGRIHPLAGRNMLASPPLVVAYALAGTVLKDITTEPLGHDADGNPVLLSDLWPDAQEVDQVMRTHLSPDHFQVNYRAISTVSEGWNDLDVDTGAYAWPDSTYVTWPRYLSGSAAAPDPEFTLAGLRPLAILGDSITTDHISPSGAIGRDSAAGRFLIDRGVAPKDFNSFGTRRGSSDIIVRSTFANVRLANEMTPDKQGSWTRLEPEGSVVPIFDAIEAYQARGEKLVVVAGKEYGCGSSRDTAAKAPWLAGVRAVIAESFERIHRSNLINMGIAPLQFPEGVSRKTLGLDGTETYDIALSDDLTGASLTLHRQDGGTQTVPLELRLYNDAERATFRCGGLLPRAYRGFVEEAA